MKQVLIYLVEFLKEQYGMSMSEMSKGLGKGRNFIREAITRGYENEEKYKGLIADLRYNFFVNGDYADFFKFMEKKHQESIDSYKVALKQSIESNLEEIDKKNKTISALEHRIVVLSRDVDKGCEEVNKLNEVIAKKDLFIDGQDEELKGLRERVNILGDKNNSQQDSIKALCSGIKDLDLTNKQLQDEVINLEVSKAKYNGALWLVSGLCLVLAFNLVVKL